MFTPFFAPGVSSRVFPSASLPIPQKVTPFHAITLGSGGAYGTIIDAATYPPNCTGKTTTPAESLVYLGSGLSLADISPKYRTLKSSILCYDRWKWTKKILLMFIYQAASYLLSGGLSIFSSSPRGFPSISLRLLVQILRQRPHNQLTTRNPTIPVIGCLIWLLLIHTSIYVHSSFKL